jgi:predicted RNase H-related nuclease YkuK (DUF458 family)
MTWRRLNGEQIPNIREMVENTILQELSLGNDIRICIGTDSQMHGENAEFATAVVFLRNKRGGFFFVNKDCQKWYGGIRQRMLEEVTRSITTAYDLCELLDRYDIPMEVHADINTDPQFMSNVALKEAMGYILGMGFQFKAKPEAFASSSCANKVVQ